MLLLKPRSPALEVRAAFLTLSSACAADQGIPGFGVGGGGAGEQGVCPEGSNEHIHVEVWEADSLAQETLLVGVLLREGRQRETLTTLSRSLPACRGGGKVGKAPRAPLWL